METVIEEKTQDFKTVRVIDDNVQKEVIFGNVYMMASPSKRHQEVVGNIYFNLRYENEKNCEIIIAPFDIKLECRGENIVQPDVVILCEDYPCAIFEVLSPSSAFKDKVTKKQLYECAGVKEYFLVAPEYEIIDKFELKDDNYEFVGSFSKEDKIKINCIDTEIEIDKIFKD